MFYQLEHIGTEGYFRREEGENFNFALHLHQSFELILLSEGEMTVTVNDTPCVLHKGEALLIFPNQLHSICSVSSKHVLFIFSPHLVRSFFSEKKGKLPKHNRPILLNKEYVQMLEGLSQQSSTYKIKGALYLICDLIDQQAEYYDISSNKQDALSKILLFIEDNYKTSCTVCDIARGTSYSPEYISRTFRKHTGISCKHYITARRLSYATYLLTETDEKCLSCALECGFTSLRSFNRNFKKYLNVSPMEYIAQKRKK